ncbi:MAG: helix-turn-helix transcriptional regulator [Alphaproteobacteria bacterium]
MGRRDSDIGRRLLETAARLQDTRSPIAAAAYDFPDGSICSPHRHRRAQLIYACSGVMTVFAAGGAWVVPPDRGVWMPAGVEHWIAYSGAVQMRTIYLEPACVPRMPARCFVIHVSALLRELIIAALDIPLDRRPAGRHAHIAKLIPAEIRALPAVPLHLPIPEDELIAPIARAIIDRPGAPHALRLWSGRTGLSERTLERHFLAATGMSFARWRRQARLVASLPRIARGEPILDVALDLGYDSPSAFTAMFHRTLGATPSAYFAIKRGGGASGASRGGRSRRRPVAPASRGAAPLGV